MKDIVDFSPLNNQRVLSLYIMYLLNFTIIKKDTGISPSSEEQQQLLTITRLHYITFRFTILILSLPANKLRHSVYIYISMGWLYFHDFHKLSSGPAVEVHTQKLRNLRFPRWVIQWRDRWEITDFPRTQGPPFLLSFAYSSITTCPMTYKKEIKIYT